MATNGNVIRACRLFAKAFDVPTIVYYPGCGNDASPAIAFPDSTVIFLDPVHEGLNEIRRELPVSIIVCTKAESVPPGARYDLVLDIHSHAPFEAEIRDLKVGGYLLIANKMSDRAFDHPRLELAAVMPWETGFSDAGLADIETEDLDRYKEIDPNHPEISFSNKRKIKVPFYVFRKFI